MDENINIDLSNTNQIQSAECINIEHFTSEEVYIFFSGADVKENQFIILPVNDTDYFIRYAIKTTKENSIYPILSISILTLPILFILCKIQSDIFRQLV